MKWMILCSSGRWQIMDGDLIIDYAESEEHARAKVQKMIRDEERDIANYESIIDEARSRIEDMKEALKDQSE